MKEEKSYYPLIDIMKFIFAIFVVGIHSEIMNDGNSNVQLYILNILFRIAVPFFFVSSGFFYGMKIRDGKMSEYSKKQLKRLCIPFVFWLIVSLPYIIIMNGGSEIIFLNIIKRVTVYPWGALWFLSAMMVAIILECFFIKKVKFKYIIILSVSLYIIALLGDNYYFILKGTVFQKVMDIYLKFFISVRNGVLVGFPLFTAGIVISKKEHLIEKISNKKLILALLFFIIIQILEINFIRAHSYTSDHNLFFSTIFIATLLVILCIKNRNIKIKKVNTVLLRNLSTGIYFMHKSMILYYMSLIKNDINNWIRFLITCVISITFCLVLYKINNKYINYLIK